MSDEIKRYSWRIFYSAAISGAGAALAAGATRGSLRGAGAFLAVFNGIYAILWIFMAIEATKEATLREKPKDGGN